MSDIAIKIENLKKQYRLGTIGGTTLNAELQSWWAKKRGKTDPNLKLGKEQVDRNEIFWALNGISVEIKKGEALGIIGANGAGKSTLLKILSRVTAPTEGDIWINGRISSMLEVGTGFNGELTGRENIYMNGAILGMTKKEVDEKIESIIDFSECRQFIDTPVKRYSSGMYVKLAFAVASHLDSEIMIMDEVLAVGDMKFQKKCLGKMGDEAKEGKTVLYVSHNMDTIRQLCTKCIVLDAGRIIFEGNTEEAIDVYLDTAKKNLLPVYSMKNFDRVYFEFGKKLFINQIEFLEKEKASYDTKEQVKININCTARVDSEIKVIIAIKDNNMRGIGIYDCNNYVCIEKDNTKNICFEMNISPLVVGIYYMYIEIFAKNSWGHEEVDESMPIVFEVVDNNEIKFNPWPKHFWGNVELGRLTLSKNDSII